MSRRTSSGGTRGATPKKDEKLSRYSHVEPPPVTTVAPRVKYDTPVPISALGLCVDVCGGAASGKSHFAYTFPGGLGWIETPPEWGKVDVLVNKFQKLYKDDKLIKIKRIESFDDIRQTLRAMMLDDEIRTIVIDSGTHLRPLAGVEWCKEEGKSSVFPSTNWQFPNTKIDQLIAEVKRSNKNLVITNRLHDEYIGDSSTGRQIRHGHRPFTYDFHIGFEFVRGLRDKSGKLFCKDHRFGRVYKNAFWDVDGDTNLNYGKPYLFNTTYDGMMAELFEPWGSGVPVVDSYNVCVEQARALFDPKPVAKKVKKVRGRTVKA